MSEFGISSRHYDTAQIFGRQETDGGIQMRAAEKKDDIEKEANGMTPNFNARPPLPFNT